MKEKIKDITYPALFTAIIAVCSWMTVPAAVPFSMQTFAVFITAGVLGLKRGMYALLTYIVLGALGLPVFAGFRGGTAVLFGNTGGYILGFIFIVITVGIVSGKYGKRPLILALAMIVGLVLCYFFGTIWFMVLYIKAGNSVTLGKVLSLCVVPFIIPDTIKIILASLITAKLKTKLKKS